MAATIVWMINIQASWFKTSFSLRQHQFSEQVMKSLDGVVKEIDQREVFRQLNSDEAKREQRRALLIARYAAQHGIAARCYQDYGWPAVKLPNLNE